MGSTVNDIILAAQQRADRVNGPMQPAEWLELANKGIKRLYGILANTNEDYNVGQFPFTLAGGSAAANSLQLGPGQVCPDFWKPRGLWLQVSGPLPYRTIPRLESFAERNLYTVPQIVPIYGSIPARWNLMGNLFEVLPPQVAGANYILWYIPRAPQLQGNQSIEGFWLSVNGWDEYAALYAAYKALVKEESLDTAMLVAQELKQLEMQIVNEAKPRDVSQPKNIVDMSAIRGVWPGVPGIAGGWNTGGDFGGGGGMW